MCFGPLIADWCQASSPRFHRGQFLCHGRADPLHREGRVEVLRGKRGAFPDNGAVWCVLRIESFDRLVCPDAGVTVLSEVDERLMMMIGCDASSTAAKYGLAAFSRNTEVIPPPSRRGHRRLLVGGRRTVGICSDQAALAWPHSNVVPSTQMQCKMTASLRAIATFAFFRPMRLASRMPQAFSPDQRFVR